MLPKILVVEDNEAWRGIYTRGLEGLCELLTAATQEEAQVLFRQHKDELKIIVMDACVPGDWPNTHSLTRTFRAEFPGPILAVSSIRDYAEELVKDGASEAVRKDKALDRLRELLKTT